MQSEGQHKHRRCVLGSHSGREPSRRVTCPSQQVEMLLTFIFFLCSSANCRMPTTSKPSVAFPNCGRAGPTASFGGIWLMIPLRMTRSISAGYVSFSGRSRCRRWASFTQKTWPHASPVLCEQPSHTSGSAPGGQIRSATAGLNEQFLPTRMPCGSYPCPTPTPGHHRGELGLHWQAGRLTSVSRK